MGELFWEEFSDWSSRGNGGGGKGLSGDEIITNSNKSKPEGGVTDRGASDLGRGGGGAPMLDFIGGEKREGAGRGFSVAITLGSMGGVKRVGGGAENAPFSELDKE